MPIKKKIRKTRKTPSDMNSHYYGPPDNVKKKLPSGKKRPKKKTPRRRQRTMIA